MKKLILTFLALAFIPAAGQVESAAEITFRETSITEPYEPKGKYAHVRSKRGTEGVDPTDEADAILDRPVKEIVLVFTEMTPADDRKEANLERWENLLYTYPEFFQAKTKYTNVCQCNPAGDESAFKKVQGFYIYYTAEGGAGQQAAAEAPARTEPPAPKKEEAAPKKEEPVAARKEKPTAETKAAEPEKTREPEPVKTKKETAREEIPETREEDAPVTRETRAEEEEAPKVAKKPAARKPGAKGKPRRAKDPRACRPACYGYGNEDIDTWYLENVELSKKQKRKGKKLMANVNMQLAADGSVTRAMVTGPNEEINKKVQEATMKMTQWKAAVRNGVAVKSQVRMTLKFDTNTKGLKTTDVIVNPKPSAKCVCVSDEELFGED